ncbi:transposase [Chryseobacterium piperi]|uniref:Transposase n=2 Tax=Chryseobacterium piperi TaxID=558152 RepID=A0A086BMS7_9FLAO|nr:transposase [Chryseobacterium piperi]ASW75030.1 transposase [Chryseobacterium piperi]KFF30241.1 transposase [Chryseobacterium piperi]
MNFDFKDIHIGECIKKRIEEIDISIVRICKFLNTSEDEVYKVLGQKELPTELLLKYSKLLEYDFFRIYTQHLIIFAPLGNAQFNTVDSKQKFVLPQFRKNIYTKELIDFILELINTGQKTKLQIIEEYRIPRTTLYKWISRYNGNLN